MAARPGALSESVLTVVTWNIHACSRGLDRVAAVLAALDPDIIGLNEVERDSPRSGFIDQATVLGQMLGRFAFFGPALNGRYGNALLLANRPGTASVIRLPGGGERRSCLRAELDGGFARSPALQILVTHLGLKRSWRNEQVQAVANLMGAIPGRHLLLLGDMNARPGSSELLPFVESALTDVLALYAAEDEAPTFQNVRIDYIWASPGLAPLDVRVVDTDASDHRPIVARFMLDHASWG